MIELGCKQCGAAKPLPGSPLIHFQGCPTSLPGPKETGRTGECPILLTEAEAHWLAGFLSPKSDESATAEGIKDKVNVALSSCSETGQTEGGDDASASGVADADLVTITLNDLRLTVMAEREQPIDEVYEARCRLRAVVMAHEPRGESLDHPDPPPALVGEQGEPGIQRYGQFGASEHGAVVTFTDHAARLPALRDRVEALEARIKDHEAWRETYRAKVARADELAEAVKQYGNPGRTAQYRLAGPMFDALTAYQQAGQSPPIEEEA